MHTHAYTKTHTHKGYGDLPQCTQGVAMAPVFTRSTVFSRWSVQPPGEIYYIETCSSGRCRTHADLKTGDVRWRERQRTRERERERAKERKVVKQRKRRMSDSRNVLSWTVCTSPLRRIQFLCHTLTYLKNTYINVPAWLIIAEVIVTLLIPKRIWWHCSRQEEYIGKIYKIYKILNAHYQTYAELITGDTQVRLLPFTYS